jgi:hypothetical protein
MVLKRGVITRPGKSWTKEISGVLYFVSVLLSMDL